MSESPKTRLRNQHSRTIVIRALLNRSILDNKQPTPTALKKPRILIGTFRRFARKQPVFKEDSKAIPSGPLKLVESMISRKNSIEEVFSEDMDVDDKFTDPLSFIRRGAVIPTCQLRKVVSSLKKSGVFLRSSGKKRSPKEFSEIKLVRKRIDSKYIKGGKTIAPNPLIRRLAMRKNC